MKVLVIEDDARIADTVRRGLETEGFAVTLAADGDEGVWAATNGTFDVIVLDLMLPGRNGFKVCADLRAGGDETPILILTAKDGEYDEVEALDTGADDFLTKPFSFPVLVSRLHALLRRVAGSTGTEVVVGSLHLDPRSRRAWRDEARIETTTREFDLLLFLARRAGQVLSKATILDGVWESDFEGDPNIVEVYVARLRRKVDDPFDCESIETVRGAGYRLVPR